MNSPNADKTQAPPPITRDDSAHALRAFAILAGLLPAICNFAYLSGFLIMLVSDLRVPKLNWHQLLLLMHCTIFFLFALRFIAHEGPARNDPWQGIRGTIGLGFVLLITSSGWALLHGCRFLYIEYDTAVWGGGLFYFLILVLALCTLLAVTLILMSWWLRRDTITPSG